MLFYQVTLIISSSSNYIFDYIFIGGTKKIDKKEEKIEIEMDIVNGSSVLRNCLSCDNSEFSRDEIIQVSPGVKNHENLFKLYETVRRILF